MSVSERPPRPLSSIYQSFNSRTSNCSAPILSAKLHGHDGVRLRFHLGNAIDGLELLQEFGLGSMSSRLKISPLGSVEAGHHLEIQAPSADDPLDSLDSIDGLDGWEGLRKQLLGGNEGCFVSIGGPLNSEHMDAHEFVLRATT